MAARWRERDDRSADAAACKGITCVRPRLQPSQRCGARAAALNRGGASALRSARQPAQPTRPPPQPAARHRVSLCLSRHWAALSRVSSACRSCVSVGSCLCHAFFSHTTQKTGRRFGKANARDATPGGDTSGALDEGSSVTVHTRAAATLPRAHVSPDPSTSAGHFHRTRRYGCPLICPTWTWRTSACTQ